MDSSVLGAWCLVLGAWCWVHPAPRTPHPKNGFTLIELLIAISLMGMIILAITAVDLGARRFINSAAYEAQVQSEVSPILEWMVKDIAGAYGQSGDSGITITGGSTIEIRQLDSAPSTYTDYDDDFGIRYDFNPGLLRIIRQTRDPIGSGSWQPANSNDAVIAQNIEGCVFSAGADGRVTINLIARRAAAGSPPPVTFENPSVTLETSVFPRSSSRS